MHGRENVNSTTSAWMHNFFYICIAYLCIKCIHILNVKAIYVDGVNVLNVLDNVTVSTASPSGGDDGDIWFKVSS